MRKNELIQRRLTLSAQLDALAAEGESILSASRSAGQRALTDQENARSLAIVSQREALRTQIADIDNELANILRAEPAAPSANPSAPGYTSPVARTYNTHSDRRGKQFALDVARSFLGDPDARERISTHMAEERNARGGQLSERATGTGAFSGVVVPQYLTDMAAPIAGAARPFADAINQHELPATGMTVYIPRAVTGTTATDQAAEFDPVAEQDYDDDLLTVPVRTAAGSQTISRQAAERGVGVEDTVVQDLHRGLNANLDSNLLNKATVGLSAVATALSYTDGTPSAVELYPKLLQGPASVEATLLDASQGDTMAVMHSRRWYWLQSQLTTQFPLFGQPGVAAQLAGTNYGEIYGRGFRGLLPSGVPVIVDNNIATNKGAGTNEDEIYFAARSEAHLWEDPAAPRYIRAEQSQAKKLAVDLVLYQYYAFTFQRRPHAHKITGTGLVTPAFV